MPELEIKLIATPDPASASAAANAMVSAASQQVSKKLPQLISSQTKSWLAASNRATQAAQSPISSATSWWLQAVNLANRQNAQQQRQQQAAANQAQRQQALVARQLAASQRYTGSAPPVIAKYQQQQMAAQSRQQGAMLTGVSALASPISNPTSVWGNILTARMLQQGLSTQMGQNMLGKFGMGGPGGTMAATGILMAGAMSVGVALKSLQKVIQETVSAIDRAAKLYVFKGTSGFSDQYAAQRMSAANVVGVSTSEVMKFGAAMNYINPQLKHANDNFAKTFRTLTMTNWNWKIMQTNVESLGATVGMKASPALNGITKLFSGLAVALDKVVASKGFSRFVGALFGPIGIGAESFLSKMGGGPTEAPIGPVGQVPKRASAWEKMGLVVGGPTGASRMEQIAKAQLNMLHKIHTAIGGRERAGHAPLNQMSAVNLPRA